ncbi:unnamed protein product [Rotaria sordida]|uniref:TIR domain-containing protein n=1 Tax=Rotaria sordida TaxID=392033 RepID=A0A819D679_9BILA|nr:unnamed protein product [Rotaria sordida]CAF3829403.1 unnamed protein product [Rotaria sordida]
MQNDILQEIIPLPLPHERSIQLESELKKIISEQMTNDEILIINRCLFQTTKQKQIVLFGYNRKVIDIKKQISNIIETNILITYTLNSISAYEMQSIMETHSNELINIERKYAKLGVCLRLRLNEFSAPRHLKDEIESSIQKLLFQSTSKTTTMLESIPLFTPIAEKEEQYLKSIAQHNRCYLKTELKHNYQSYPVPKATISNKQTSKSIIEQSELFCSSTNVFKKLIIANGSIELRTGDIALQKVDTIIISTMFNGLKDGVIERLGEIEYEKTFSQIDGTMYTETNGGKLYCKRILFSNWLPNSLINNDNALRLSIQTFVSKSIEYTVKEKDTQSIAFVVPDSCTNESILVEEMINEVKRQLKVNKLQLKISFVCLPEQQTLHEQFSDIITRTNQDDISLYLEWPTTIIQIALIGSTMERVTRCKQQLNKYLSQCISTVKIIHSNDIFQSWDQQTINSFYKYCKDRCVLPKLDETKTEIELIGPATSTLEAKKKFHIFSELMKEKLYSTSTVERSSSAIHYSTRSKDKINMKMIKLYNIVINYSQNDLRKCKRLINRLTEEGFSVGTYSEITEEKHNLYSQMDKSDCIILCISENYYRNLQCIDAAKYAFQTDKKVFLVKIQNNPLLGWDNNLFEGKLFFHSFGSDNYFDLEYGRLLVELLRYTKPGFLSLLQRRSSCIQQDIDEFRRKQIGEQQSLIENQTVRTSSTSKLLEIMKSQNRIIDTTREERHSNIHLKTTVYKRDLSFIEERWLRKLDNLRKPHLSLYGWQRVVDDDDKILAQMLPNSYKVSDLYIHSVLSAHLFAYSSSFLGGFSCGYVRESLNDQPITRFSVNKIWVDEDQVHEKCPEKIQSLDGLSQVFPAESSTIDFIPRRGKGQCFNLFRMLSLGDSTNRSEKEMEKLHELENPEKMKHIREKIANYFMERYKYTKEQLDVYLKFAQRMKDNSMEFEMFCSTTKLIQ